jgi:hypothetical protein
MAAKIKSLQDLWNRFLIGSIPAAVQDGTREITPGELVVINPALGETIAKNVTDDGPWAANVVATTFTAPPSGLYEFFFQSVDISIDGSSGHNLFDIKLGSTVKYSIDSFFFNSKFAIYMRCNGTDNVTINVQAAGTGVVPDTYTFVIIARKIAD